jgi:hypothetical protein
MKTIEHTQAVIRREIGGMRGDRLRDLEGNEGRPLAFECRTYELVLGLAQASLPSPSREGTSSLGVSDDGSGDDRGGAEQRAGLVATLFLDE